MTTRYDDLIGKINKAKEDYYQYGTSMLTDQEYDALVAEAERMGYSETVGAAPVDDIAKIKHEHPMLSLDKCHSTDEIIQFIGNHDVVAMYKADGLTISATYQDGKLVRLETRGNGEVGNDIMFHANSIENLPKRISKPGKFVIDGECIILRDDFEKINRALPEDDKYSNPRNLAAGSLNLLDTSIAAKRHLRFYAWDVIEGGEDYLSVNLSMAKDLGFDVVTAFLINSNSVDCYNNIENILVNIRTLSDAVGFPIDGVVFKYDNVKYGRLLGMTGHHPRNAIAYKYEDELYSTKLKTIKWQIGKSGQIVPVAIFNPVVIDSTVVERASLHNLSIMNSLGLTNGCTVYVKKCNQIIPQIDSADPDGDGDIHIPSVCPICGAKTTIVKDNNSEVLYCMNDDCPGKLLGKYKTFVSKKGMDIDGLSEAILKKLLDLGYLTNMFVSIYELKDSKEELYKLDRFGKKLVNNLLASIEASKSTDLQHFIAAFSIPGVGEGQSKMICKQFHTFEEFSHACDDQYDFSQIPGIGSVLSGNIHKWWMLNHMQMIDVAALMNFQSDDIMNEPTGNYPLADKTFVVTGSVHHWKNRDELKSEIERLGGKVAGSVSKNTNYLINNDTMSTTGKNKKAKELNIPIISEEELLKMIG